MKWRKSRRSANGGADCVELAPVGGSVAVRDSKDSAGPRLAFDRRVWAAFTAGVKAGRYDL